MKSEIATKRKGQQASSCKLEGTSVVELSVIWPVFVVDCVSVVIEIVVVSLMQNVINPKITKIDAISGALFTLRIQHE